jgi:hypothetical protein
MIMVKIALLYATTTLSSSRWKLLSLQPSRELDVESWRQAKRHLKIKAAKSTVKKEYA